MTTAGHIRAIASPKKSEVSIAGVAWPTYKVVALVAGFAVAVIAGVVTMSAGPAVLSGSAVGALVWVLVGASQRAGA